MAVVYVLGPLPLFLEGFAAFFGRRLAPGIPCLACARRSGKLTSGSSSHGVQIVVSFNSKLTVAVHPRHQSLDPASQTRLGGRET